MEQLERSADRFNFKAPAGSEELEEAQSTAGEVGVWVIAWKVRWGLFALPMQDKANNKHLSHFSQMRSLYQ